MKSTELQPFLTIVTRQRRGRPEVLIRNVKSVNAQIDLDIEHLILRDNLKPSSIERANKSLFLQRDQVNGKWIYILDDDDLLVYEGFVEGLKKIVRKHNPHVIMVKAKISEVKQQILPQHWEASPLFCFVSSLNFVVRADIWKHHIFHFGQHSGGDFHFITDVWKRKDLQVHWWDKLVAYAPRTGRDKPPRPEPHAGHGPIRTRYGKRR